MNETISFGYHKYEFDEYGVTVEVNRFKPERSELWAYLTIEADLSKHPNMEEPHVLLQRQNLSNGTAKGRLAKTLTERIFLGDGVWDGIVELICTRSLRRHWEGSEMVQIGKKPKRKEIPYLLYPIIRKDAPCIIYGTGGIGKSYVSLYFAMLVQHNISKGRLAPRQANVLYLDWESGEDALNERLSALNKGLGIDSELNYRYCHLPLSDDIDTISQMIVEGDIGLVVVDAKGAAIGGQINEAKETMQMYNALRSLNVTSLIVDHVSKESNDGPIGSIYNLNEARNVWEMRANNVAGDGKSKIGLYHRKTNVGKRHESFGLEFNFIEDEYKIIDVVTVTESDVKDDPITRKGLTDPERIEEFLKREVNYFPDGTVEYKTFSGPEIAAELGMKEGTVRTRLSDHAGVRWERRGPNEWAYLEPATAPNMYNNGVGNIPVTTSEEEVEIKW